MSGKGDAPRPIQVDQDTYSSNWDRTFAAHYDSVKAQHCVTSSRLEELTIATKDQS